MAIQIQLRRGDAADWTSANPLLAEGELGIELDTIKIKIGNGIDNWNALAYVSGGGGGVTSVTGTSPIVSSGGTSPAISLASTYGDTLNPYGSKTANYVLASPDGSSGVPSFRAIVASDIPTLNQNTTGTAANITATSNSTLTTLSALSLPYSQLSGTVPTWNQNTTGTASNVTGTVAIANGGSGTTTAQGAMNAFAGAVTSGSYLRGNGTNVVMSTIQVADVPTLNQNTTGTASNVTGIVAVANGGTGTATPALVAGTNITITGSFPNQTINSTASGSGTVTSVAATVPSFLSVSGSPITTSGTLAFTLASTPTNGQLLIGNGTDFSYSTLTAGSNITITNSSGGITIASTGGGASSPIPKLQSWSIGAM